jgi:hypothetical protein
VRKTSGTIQYVQGTSHETARNKRRRDEDRFPHETLTRISLHRSSTKRNEPRRPISTTPCPYHMTAASREPMNPFSRPNDIGSRLRTFYEREQRSATTSSDLRHPTGLRMGGATTTCALFFLSFFSTLHQSTRSSSCHSRYSPGQRPRLEGR